MNVPQHQMPLLFAYGTLQRPDVQRSTFGRALEGRAVAIAGFERTQVPVRDPSVADALGTNHYANLRRVEDASRRVDGTVFEITGEDLAAADAHEASAGYVRIAAILASGEEAWVYVHGTAQPAARPPSVAPADLLRVLVGHAAPALSSMAEAASAVPRAPGKWSPRQIVGHLVDSAANNHQRFVRARWQDDLVFEGYDQDAWVEAHAYHARPWEELVALWRSLNLHLAHVMATTPWPVRTRVHTRHTLDRVAFRAVATGQPVTLEFLMEDYNAHLLHHLRQVLGAAWAVPEGAP